MVHNGTERLVLLLYAILTTEGGVTDRFGSDSERLKVSETSPQHISNADEMLHCHVSTLWARTGREQPQQVFGNVIKVRLPFSLRQRLGDLAGVFDEKLRDWAERAVLQGNNSDWHAGMLQFNGQNLDVRTLGKTQYRTRDNRNKAPGRQKTNPHRGVSGENSRARIVESTGAKGFQINRPERVFRRWQQPCWSRSRVGWN